VTGELVGASENEVTIAAGEGIVTIPYEHIIRSNLIPGDG
jgi:ribosome maturation factor RimP